MKHPSTRARAGRSARCVALGVAATLWAGCAVENFGTPHPVDAVRYPVGIVADPSGERVWVTSGNFDLRFRGGAVLALELDSHRWVPGSAAEVGSFPGPATLWTDGDGVTRDLYLTSRETDALYHLTVGRTAQGAVADTPTDVDCAEGRELSNGIVTCPETGALVEGEVPDPEGGDPTTLALGRDPYRTVVLEPRFGYDGEPTLMLTASMVGGTVTVSRIDPTTGALIVDQALDLDAGLLSLVANPVTGRIYAISKDVATLAVLRVDAPTPEDFELAQGLDAPFDVPAPTVRLVATLATPSSLQNDHGRGATVSPDGSRLYLAYRSPASLVVLDVGAGADGLPRNAVVQKIPLGADPGEVALVPASDGLPELVYVTAFSDDRIDVVDPAVGTTVASVPTCRGPYDAAAVLTSERRRLYVSCFYDHAVGVIELDPTSPSFHQTVAEVR